MDTGRKLVNGTAAALPDLTTERFPHLQRGNFAALADHHLRHFEDLLGTAAVLTDPVKVAAHNIDWDRHARGGGTVVLLPATTQQVADVLAYCNRERLAVTPQGGNTGLVWGSVPVFDEIVLSTQVGSQGQDQDHAGARRLGEMEPKPLAESDELESPSWAGPLCPK